MGFFDNAVDKLSSKSSLIWYGAGGVLLILLSVILSSWILAVVGIAQLALGVASTMFHFGYERWWRKADMIMIFVFFNLVMARQLEYVFVGWTGYLLLAFTGIGLVMALTHSRWDHDDIGLLGIYNVIFMGYRVIVSRGFIGVVQWLAAITFYGLALYHGQNAKIKDSHRHKDPGHAKWHRYSAIANTLLAI